MTATVSDLRWYGAVREQKSYSALRRRNAIRSFVILY